MIRLTVPFVIPLLIVCCWVSTATTQTQPPVLLRALLSVNVRAFEGEYPVPLGAFSVFVGEPLEFDVRVTGGAVESDWVKRLVLTIRPGSPWDKEAAPSLPLQCDPLIRGTHAVGARTVDDTLVLGAGGYHLVRCRVRNASRLAPGQYTVTVTWGPDADMSRFRLTRGVDGTARTYFYLREPADDAEEVDRLNNLAARAEHDEDFRETSRRASEALVLRPLSVRALLLRGMAHEKLGMCREAIADWNAAATILANRSARGIDDDPQHAAYKWRERAASLRCQ
jgi:hypothetical protein